MNWVIGLEDIRQTENFSATQFKLTSANKSNHDVSQYANARSNISLPPDAAAAACRRGDAHHQRLQQGRRRLGQPRHHLSTMQSTTASEVMPKFVLEPCREAVVRHARMDSSVSGAMHLVPFSSMFSEPVLPPPKYTLQTPLCP